MRLDPKAIGFNLKIKIHKKIKHVNIKESVLFLNDLLFVTCPFKKENRTHRIFRQNNLFKILRD